MIVSTMLILLVAGAASAVRPGITVVKEGKETTTPKEPATTALSEAPNLIGGQMDSHGCLGPAGFAWNATAGKCMRPWNGEVQLAAGTMMVNVSDPNWREKLVMPTPISADIKCVDSDGGKDAFTKGIVFVYGKNPKYDSCVRHRFLKEWRCSGNQAVSSFVVCKEGCNDGACNPELEKTQFLGPPISN